MKIALLSIFLLGNSTAIAAPMGVTWNGHIRALLESGEGSNGTSISTALARPRGAKEKFSIANARISAKATMNRVFSKLQVELADGENNRFRLKDGYVGYELFKRLKFQVGRFKVPIGIDHLISNSQLDIIEENVLTTHLTFGRKNGLMLSGDLIGSIVFDVGIFASENTLYRWLENTMVARLMWDIGNLHLEWAFANQEGKDISSTVHSTRDTSTMAFGASYDEKRWRLKGEYLKGSYVGLYDPSSATFDDTFDMTTMYVHWGYDYSQKTELVIRHYMSSAKNTVNNYEASLGNTYLGFNYTFLKNFMFKVNYVLVNGDDATTKVSGNTGPFPAIANPGGGAASGQRTANTFLALAQIMF